MGARLADQTREDTPFCSTGAVVATRSRGGTSIEQRAANVSFAAAPRAVLVTYDD